MLRRLLPRGLPFWAVAASWDTYPFRIVWAGFWQFSYDRSHAWYSRWPHISVNWFQPSPSAIAGCYVPRLKNGGLEQNEDL